MATVSRGKSGRRHKLMDQVRNNNTRFRAGGGWEPSMGCHISFFLQWLEAGTAPWQQRSRSVQLRKKTFREGQHLLPEYRQDCVQISPCQVLESFPGHSPQADSHPPPTRILSRDASSLPSSVESAALQTRAFSLQCTSVASAALHTRAFFSQYVSCIQ